MISIAQPLSAGNAAKLVLRLATGAIWMRVLAKATDTFAGPTDPAALTVIDECEADFIVDARDSLTNGAQIFYRCYDWTGSAYLDQGISFPVTPATSFMDDDGLLDPQEFVRDRIGLGLAAAVTRGFLLPQTGVVQTFTAPFSIAEGTNFPCVSVHLEQSGQDTRFLGDELEDFLDDQTGEWIGTEGWYGREVLSIVGVSQNADERIQLRKVINQIILANLPVFNGVGIRLVEFNQTDSEQFTENNVPLYMTNGTFSCLAPSWVREREDPITDIQLNPGVQIGASVPDFYGFESI